MKFQPSSYNPLANIFKMLDVPFGNILDLHEIRKELEHGGIIFENEEEFVTALDVLVEINPRKYVRQEN